MEIQYNSDKVPQIRNNEFLLVDIRSMIAEARRHVATTANATITLLYWHIGERINREVLDNQRAEYGKHIVDDIGRHLTVEYGRGFDAKSLRRMMQFANNFGSSAKVRVRLTENRAYTVHEKLLTLQYESYRKRHISQPGADVSTQRAA